jgi:Na+-transporting NADH:ubiquinone oxidoreductase subunit NqrC
VGHDVRLPVAGPDANTVRGLTYYDHRETPGLGGEIGNPSVAGRWQGRKGYDDQWRARITVIKGPAGPPEAIRCTSTACRAPPSPATPSPA